MFIDIYLSWFTWHLIPFHSTPIQYNSQWPVDNDNTLLSTVHREFDSENHQTLIIALHTYLRISPELYYHNLTTDATRKEEHNRAQQTCWYSNDDWNPNQKRTKRDAKWLLFHIPSATATVGTTTKCLAVAGKNTNSTKYRTKAHQHSCTILHPIIPFPMQETNRPTPAGLTFAVLPPHPSSSGRDRALSLCWRWWWICRHNYNHTNFIPYLYRSLASPSSSTQLAPKWEISVCPLPPLYTSLPRRRVIAEQIVESMSSPLYYQFQHHRDIILCVRTRARSSSLAYMSLQASALLMRTIRHLHIERERELSSAWLSWKKENSAITHCSHNIIIRIDVCALS